MVLRRIESFHHGFFNMHLVAAGLSFHSAPLGLRERASVSAAEAPDLLRHLVGHAGIAGAAVLSTCNRTEFYVACSTDELAGQVATKLGRYLDPGNGALAEHLVTYRETAAISHLCHVATGLDSMVVGEAEVLGQVRAAHRLAANAGILGADLDIVFRGAIETGKRVRTKTAIGHGTGSLTGVALDIARASVGDLRGVGVLLIGAGKMNRLAARRLIQMGARVHVTSRSESARHLAADIGGIAIERAAILDAVAGIDLVIASTSSTAPVLTARDMGLWQARRQSRPLCVIDLAVPRDVEPAAAGVPGVTLIDIDELGGRVEDGMDARRQAIPEAQAIVEAEVSRIAERLRHREGADPTIAALVERAEILRHQEMGRSLGRMPDLDGMAVERIDQLTQSLVRKLLHAPIGHLRTHAGDPVAVQAIREIFELDGGAVVADSQVAPDGPVRDAAS